MGRSKQNKSQHKTLRLTEQAKFAVTFWAQHEGQSGNAFVEAAIKHYAKHMAKETGTPWAGLWHIQQSVRELRLFQLTDDQFPFDDEQAARRDFVLRHADFFYIEQADGTLTVNEDNAPELYPKLDEFRSVEGDHWAAGNAMAKHLKARGITPPVWPPNAEKSAP